LKGKANWFTQPSKSTTMSLCKHCISGVTHEGTPQGKIVDIGGVRSYVATPAGDYATDKVILFLTDAFGPDLINNKLLVDDFARHGFKTVSPDYFNGDSVPENAFSSASGVAFDLAKWFSNHGADVTRPVLDKVIAALKEEGVVSFGATGYCFGGRYTFDLAFDKIIKAAVVSHPSLLKVPDDLTKYAQDATAPLLINSCTVDGQFPLEAQAQADEILGNGKFRPGYKREHFEGCTHGFAVRGDLSDPKVKAGKEGSFVSAVEWFHAYL